MERLVKVLPGKRKAEDETTPNASTTKTKTRKYGEAYLTLCFTSTTVDNEERTQCVVSQNIRF